MALLAIAAVSARMLAEAAVCDGYEVIALDCFGDVDTRRAATEWHSIGAEAVPLAIDSGRLLAALSDVATRFDAIGWIAGAGTEADADVFERGAALLPLLASSPESLRRLRAPRVFFERLDALGVPHPETRYEPPAVPAGWLRKDAGGHGGWHVRRATAHEPAPTRREYFQREAQGTPLSATFIAAGGAARVLGCNELIVRRFGARPFVYGGCIGPLPLPRHTLRAMEHAVQSLAREFALRGLASLDFMLDGEEVSVLEVNARPSASMALYGAGLLRAHVQACAAGVLPPAVPHDAMVAGHEIVYASRPLRLSQTAAARLAAMPHCHDLPAAGTRFANGDPLCSISARAADAAQVRELLAARRAALCNLLETST